MDTSSEGTPEDASFTDSADIPSSRHQVSTFPPVVYPKHAAAVIHDYRYLIRNPCSVFNDGLYRLIEWLPGHPLLWALLLGFGLVVPLGLIDDTGSPINHVRSYTEVHASYFFFPVIIVQLLVMPVFYQAILKCFDSLSYAMNISDASIAELRASLINPGIGLQLKTLATILLLCVLSEEFSAARFSRFLSGDWNSLDLWLLFANITALTMFLWYLVMPIGRTLLLARSLEATVSPRLFDENLGEPVAAFGLSAGLLFAVPYFFVGSFAPIVLSDSWTYVLPGVMGTLTAIGFSIVPAVPLRRIKRKLKIVEVQKVNAAMARIDIDVSGDDLSVDRLSEIVTLLDYGREVKALREWPFEARLIRGFGLYFLLIPMTWVGAAFVEMIVEQLAV